MRNCITFLCNENKFRCIHVIHAAMGFCYISKMGIERGCENSNPTKYWAWQIRVPFMVHYKWYSPPWVQILKGILIMLEFLSAVSPSSRTHLKLSFFMYRRWFHKIKKRAQRQNTLEQYTNAWQDSAYPKTKLMESWFHSSESAPAPIPPPGHL